MNRTLTPVATAAHYDAFYASLPDTTRADVDHIVEIHKAHGRTAAEHAYSKLILRRELKTWEAVAIGSVIKSRMAPTTQHNRRMT
jgi:hypothetical protein